MNQNNIKDLVISTFQEILSEDPNLFLPNQLKILSWKSKKITGALITKIGNQRYLGLIRKDSQGQDYWKYRPLNRNSEPEQSGPENLAIQSNNSPHQLEKEEINSELPLNDNIAKFQQRQMKTQELNHGKSNNPEPAVNSQTS